jgi:hypothetical protein
MFEYSYQKWDYQNDCWADGLARFSDYDTAKDYCKNTWMNYRILHKGEVIEIVESWDLIKRKEANNV